MSSSCTSLVGSPWVAESRPPSGATTSTRTNGTLKVEATAPASVGSCSSTEPLVSSRAASAETAP